MRVLAFLILATLGACSEQSEAEANATKATDNDLQSATAIASSVVQTASGRYQVELDQKLDTKSLPQNADLKMVDGDLTQYAANLCGLDFTNKLRPERCEVFVQSDRSGLLVGYAVLTQAQNVSIATDVETDRQKGGQGCIVRGELENSDYANSKAKLNIGGNFDARLMYRAWERSPGDWLIAPFSDDPNEEGAVGVWYVKRQNNKLRISQERWSYCYSDSTVYIDEVFSHALTLTRLGD